MSNFCSPNKPLWGNKATRPFTTSLTMNLEIRFAEALKTDKAQSQGLEDAKALVQEATQAFLQAKREFTEAQEKVEDATDENRDGLEEAEATTFQDMRKARTALRGAEAKLELAAMAAEGQGVQELLTEVVDGHLQKKLDEFKASLDLEKDKIMEKLSNVGDPTDLVAQLKDFLDPPPLLIPVQETPVQPMEIAPPTIQEQVSVQRAQVGIPEATVSALPRPPNATYLHSFQ